MHEIMVVDDDDAVRAAIVTHLSRLEVRAIDFADARSAINAMLCRKFDLVITDLFMPDVDGIKFISEIRRINPAMMIILVTGGGTLFPIGSRNFGTVADAAKILGARHILQKPFRGAQLREMVTSLLKPQPRHQ